MKFQKFNLKKIIKLKILIWQINMQYKACYPNRPTWPTKPAKPHKNKAHTSLGL